MRPLFAWLAVAALSLLPSLVSAAPAVPPNTSSAPDSALLAQYQPPPPPPGWWEQSGRGDELRDRYWHLPPRARYRYDQLEGQIRDLQARQEQLRREQRRILRWAD